MTQVASRALKKVGKGTAEKTSLQNMHKNMYSKFLWHLVSQKSDNLFCILGGRVAQWLESRYFAGELSLIYA